jgi:hypothetical protein
VTDDDAAGPTDGDGTAAGPADPAGDGSVPRWGALFERGAAAGVTRADVEAALESVRARESRDGTGPDADGDRDRDGSVETDADTDTDADTEADADAETTGGSGADGRRPDPSPARVVADADVLVADLVGVEAARAALDGLRAHSWTTLVASDRLVADATAVVAAVADRTLAADWRRRLAAWREPVDHPAGDHPALASAYRGGAMHLLSYDDRLTGPRTAANLQGRIPLSVRDPAAFAALFDADSLYREVVGGEYPGPDRDPRD